MPYKEKPVEKSYYRIGEVAEMFGVNTSLIRFWEKEFDIIQPRKNKKGYRFFTQKDIENFHLIYHYVKERGMTLQGARQKLKDNRDDSVNNFSVVASLQQIRAMLLEIRDNLE
ncbi:MAG: MerR family transcriptional regulator [Bacteroidales bacterium]|nr:MerR family transcriptional regulator [Bacteroidales bacterium]